MKSTWWQSNEWNALCDECGFKFKAQQLKRRWDGLMVCSDCWEIRHPQELIRPIPDQTKLPWTRPDPANAKNAITINGVDIVQSTDNFVAPVCTPWGIQAVAGLATPGCFMPSFDRGFRHEIDITHNA